MNQTELNQMLREQQLWSESNGKEGKRANLRGADLCKADLRDLDLCGVDLRGTCLSGADLRCAFLCNTILWGADLSNANLSDTILPHYKIYPEEGSFMAWKKLAFNHIAKIEVPADAKRISCLTSRKGRADKIKILEICNPNGERSRRGQLIDCWRRGSDMRYKEGETYETELNEDIRVCCTKGFHFFLTRDEAVNW